MAWELRNGQSYYYRSVRLGTRVTKEYVGSGYAGTLAEARDVGERRARAAERERAAADREQLAALESATREVESRSELLLAALLMTAGYRHHDRGEWRRRRA
jgi:hypothetical protein